MRVREADIREERGAILEVLRDGGLPHATPAHYDWLYLSNPFGPARAWVVEDEAGGGLIGAAAAFPRPARVQGRIETCWNLGDFAIARSHRALGPAIRLQRACLGPVLSGEVPFAYDHPSRGMLAIYDRLGVAPIGTVVRYARRIRVDDKITNVLGNGMASRGLGAVGSLILRVTGGGLRRPSRIRTDRLAGRFDSRVDGLRPGGENPDLVHGDRTAEYLNWRYLDHPTLEFEVFATERDGKLGGYAVFRAHAGVVIVADVNTGADADSAEMLLRAVIDVARRRGAHTVNVPALSSGASVSALKRLGFVAREESLFVVATEKGGRLDGVVNVEGNWFYSDGDRDV